MTRSVLVMPRTGFRSLWIVVAMVAALLPVLAVEARAVDHVAINEIRIDQPGGDSDEYFELVGDGGASLDGLTYLVIGDGAGGSGVIEAVIDLDGSSIPPSGLFVAAESSFTLSSADLVTSLNFENSDNFTHLLVDEFTGANGDDLDTNDDGILDSTPWGNELDRIALVEEDNPPSSTEYHYGPPAVGPDGSFVPGHAYNCPDGWRIGGFSLGTDDTPGAENTCTPTGPIDLFINQIQGDGDVTPYAGQLVRVEGVVVGDFQGDSFDSQLAGFFMMEESGDQDGDPATSEGIFVFTGFGTVADVSVGQVVEVIGTAGEFQEQTQISGSPTISVTGSLTESDVAALATPISLPVASTADWEKYEGMLVETTQDLVVSEYFNYDRYVEITLATSRQFQPTEIMEPGPAAVALSAEQALARIKLDDGRLEQNPDFTRHPNGNEFTLTNTFRGGDIVMDVIGILAHMKPRSTSSSFVEPEYRIHPTGPAVHVPTNPRPTDVDVKGKIHVASFNVLNFFTTIDQGPDTCGPTGQSDCRGADSEEEFDRQLAKLLAGIQALDADVIGFQEVESGNRDADEIPAHDAILRIVDELNAIEGAGTWAWVGEPVLADGSAYYNDYPIRNEIIYRTDAVIPVGLARTIASDAFDALRPGDIEPVGRPPLAQTFAANWKIDDDEAEYKKVFTVIVNHYKSKGSSCSSIGDPFDSGGQGNCNLTRVAQSEALLEFADDLQEEVGDQDILIIGDLNSYGMEDPIDVLTDADYTDLLTEYEGEEAYGYVFDGRFGSLDHALASRSLRWQVKDAASFHINADEPDIFDYNIGFKSANQAALFEAEPYRVSDHDPLVVGLKLKGNDKLEVEFDDDDD